MVSKQGCKKYTQKKQENHHLGNFFTTFIPSSFQETGLDKVVDSFQEGRHHGEKDSDARSGTRICSVQVKPMASTTSTTRERARFRTGLCGAVTFAEIYVTAAHKKNSLRCLSSFKICLLSATPTPIHGFRHTDITEVCLTGPSASMVSLFCSNWLP